MSFWRQSDICRKRFYACSSSHRRNRTHLTRFETLENRLCLSSVHGSVWHDLNNNGIRENFVAGGEPDVVMVIDESGSTDSYFGQVGVSGQISVSDAWSSGISVSNFVDPVIIVSPVSYADSDPTVARVDYNAATSSFKVKVDEWDYLDGSHGSETLNYLVIEAGQHKLDDGTIIEAGMIEVDSNSGWVSFCIGSA